MQTRNMKWCVAAALFAAVGAGASASIINATITADNHYALYADGPDGIMLIGGNELGSAGSPGTYNWSVGESYTFSTLGTIYIAVWSDDRVAQGLLADIRTAEGVTYHSGHVGWEVMMTGESKSDGSAWPLASEITSHVNLADQNSLWDSPFVGPNNLPNTGPWGKIAGIDDEARWAWGNPYRSENPLIGGADLSEFQIFRMSLPVPNPGTAVLCAGGVLLAIPRRRKA